MNSKQLSVSSKHQVGWAVPTIASVILMALCLCGCDGFRYAATEAQKENAWLHQQVCAMASQTARDESASEQLCGLTDLSHQQSAAFVTDYGLPESPQPIDNIDALLVEGSTVATAAQSDAARRPDMWTLADSAIQLGIALAGLIGGVYGVRVAGYLKTARDKSKALKEIIEGNELFKQLYPEHSERFKQAQQKQSPATKQIITEIKTG